MPKIDYSIDSIVSNHGSRKRKHESPPEMTDWHPKKSSSAFASEELLKGPRMKSAVVNSPSLFQVTGYKPRKRFDPRYPLPEKPRQKRAVIQDMVRPLKKWLLRHRHNPYPTKGEKVQLALGSNMTLVQVSNWFANARRRLKNVVQEPHSTWSKRLRLYNQYVQGNAELLSISSDDSIWNSEEDEASSEVSKCKKRASQTTEAEEDGDCSDNAKFKKCMLNRYLADSMNASDAFQAQSDFSKKAKASSSECKTFMAEDMAATLSRDCTTAFAFVPPALLPPSLSLAAAPVPFQYPALMPGHNLVMPAFATWSSCYFNCTEPPPGLLPWSSSLARPSSMVAPEVSNTGTSSSCSGMLHAHGLHDTSKFSPGIPHSTS